ncbi:unnamed protein product, partial [marine sediment metagenome]
MKVMFAARFGLKQNLSRPVCAIVSIVVDVTQQTLVASAKQFSAIECHALCAG